ncbi:MULTISPECIES: hypothetical protein [unclassified Agarivorans]|uniref:hypothetical protein n=1 Tax=unclassified Agarivorans TaxID=2636026 RepID=UPI0026E281F5|nr:MULTISPECIES: hypothetical protein [unclassified Agarivorans]MDO6683894.1 hypothetical protein [Agarivorans sp. 3_MG-2023]MDO6714373.1 hypothetical protein [Agarivorans sp. 2_MG-2023]
MDDKTSRFIDIDLKKANRQASELHTHILKTYTPINDQFDVIGKVLPLCEQLLNGTIKIAIDVDALPLKYQTREGLLPNELDILFSAFCTTITGTPLEELDIKRLDGEFITKVNFE